jgi:hypothetical protein
MTWSRWLAPLRVLAILLAILDGGCRTGSDGGGRRPLPSERDVAAEIRKAEEIGRTLYFLDRAATIASEAIVKHVGPPADVGIAGWLPFKAIERKTGGPSNDHVVMFFTKEEPVRIPFAVTVAAGDPPVIRRNHPPLEAPASLASMIRARQAALAAMPRNGQPINAFVLGRAVGTNDFVVYLLAAPKKPGEMVLGMHYRALVGEDGRVVEMRPLSTTALVLSDDLRPGAVRTFRSVTHSLTDWPLETHAFASIVHRDAPLYVITHRGQWSVIRGRIEFMGPVR